MNTDAPPFMNTYHRLPVVFEKGENCRLYSTDGRSFIDFTSGIAVNSLGHNNKELVEAISTQAAKLLHVSNYFQSDVSLAFAEKLVAVSKMERVFLCNSGAEANEGAIKIARKYSEVKYGAARHKIVTLTGSFHGRTITTLAATGQEKFHKHFGPFTEGFEFIPPNDLNALENALDGKTAALMLECIQGESGVLPLNKDFVLRAADICREKDIILIFDEVQCGAGRTGRFFCFEHFGVQADIATLAKGLAGGVPAGAVLAGKKTAQTLETGDHGSTFGGNALAAAAGLVVLRNLENPAFMAKITEKGEYLMEQLRALDSKKIVSVRGRGLMIACDITVNAWDVLENLIKMANKKNAGLLLLSAGEKTLRFLPPYTISRSDIDAGLDILKRVL